MSGASLGDPGSDLLVGQPLGDELGDLAFVPFLDHDVEIRVPVPPEDWSAGTL